MDFTKLKAAAMKDGDDEEAVTVNTRALIDKVLARYSGEWTTLRELLQNAADAQASTVTIKFETLPSTQVPLPLSTNASESLKHALLHHTLRSLLVTNDGQAFGNNDWSRLKRIAEGNPDETKIGAFGVGFYSVFADCEEPFVSSGNEAMAFYWKGNSLFTKKLQLATGDGNPKTSFVLEYRNTTTPMPNLLSIAQFLATSLTFVALKNIELWVDDWKIILLQKKAAPSIGVPIARDVETKTKEGLMKVQSLDRESVQMDATFMNVVGWKPSITVSKPGSYDNAYGSTSEVPSLRSFFSRLTSSTSHAQLKTKAIREEQALQEVMLEDLTAYNTANVFLRVTTAVVKTSVTAAFAAELERATKKPPPKITKLAILTSSYDETAASSAENSVVKGVDLFSSVLPGKKPGGRIFIGFPTHQTTGAGMHLSAPSVIPTVERESIDLNARWVRTWNLEMLRVAGIMARLAFANEMSDLSAKVMRATELAGHGTKVSKVEISKFLPEALHTLKTFTFGESTPSSQVSQIIEEAFWTAYKKPSIEIYSTRGVLPTTKVRLATEDLSGFVEGIPVVPHEISMTSFVEKLKDYGLLVEITVSDVKGELRAKALTKNQLIQFIGWASQKAKLGHIDHPTIQSLLDVAVATVEEGGEQGGIIVLGTIKNYVQIEKLHADVPVPPTTIPFQFTKACARDSLQALGWEPLEIVPWLRFLIETNRTRPLEQNLTSDIKFAALVLLIISKQWEMLSPNMKDSIVTLLRPLTIIPTKLGMKVPEEAFFASVKLFDDLPIITQCPGVKERFLATIGVRKTVDLETIFSRLLAPTQEAKSGEISKDNRHMEVIKYLASVRADIPAVDLKRLKSSTICPAEAGPKGMESTQGTARLWKVSDLFEPKDSIRGLGLPILQWAGPPGSYRPSSVEGQFLSSLGLRPYPSVVELIEMMSGTDVELRTRAMTYFITNHHINSYASTNLATSQRAFLRLEGDPNRLVSPTECFTNEGCRILGFNILAKGLHPHANKFGVALDPPITECVNRLIANPPRSPREATVFFCYFASRLGEIGPSSVAKLGDAHIVPVIPRTKRASLDEKKLDDSGDLKYLNPRQCYLGSSVVYEDIFDFVNFGDVANTFLLKCGSKHEPTKVELASLACREPARLLGIMESPEKYLNMLRTLADDLPTLKRDKALFSQMKQSKFLLGTVEASSDQSKRQSFKSEIENDSDEEPEDAPAKVFQLAFPSQIVIVDDYSSYRLFKKSLICAPMEDKLEDFYSALGAMSLGSLVQEDLRLGSPREKQDNGVKLREHVLERSKLFLYEFSRDQIKHDSRWLEKNLSVQIVNTIQVRRTLRGHSLFHTEKRSAAIRNERNSGWTLFITEGSYDSYQISQALCKVLLERPSQQACITFETILTFNLLQLRSRGYNVERILRAKAVEQRIAEEDRRKQLEAEQEMLKDQREQQRQQQQRLKEQGEQWRNDPQLALPAPPATPISKDISKGNELSPHGHVPGDFGSDSTDEFPDPVPAQKKRGLFSNLSRRFGFDKDDDYHEHPKSLSGEGSSRDPQLGADNPPPYDQVSQDPKTKDVSKGAGSGGAAESEFSSAAVEQNLLSAISSSRAHNSSTLFSPPSTNVIRESSSYCDSTSAQNLKFIAKTSNNTKIYISKELTERQPTITATATGADFDVPSGTFISTNYKGLDDFGHLLRDVANIYNLNQAAMHIFYDNQGPTIAFNSSGSIFCNFRFWKKLHQGKLGKESQLEATAYWWVVVAHELAHNLVSAHDSQHSFYTENLIATYFPKMMAKASSYQ